MTEQDPVAPQEPPAAPAQTPPGESAWMGLKRDFKWAGPVIFFAVIGMAGLLYGSWQVAPTGTEDLGDVTDTLFATGNHSFAAASEPRPAGAPERETTNVLVGFELLSALLLAALIAGVVIAMRERGDE